MIKSTAETTITTNVCAFCGSTELMDVIDFGEVAIAGAFIQKEEISTEKKYPLVVAFCKTCYVVQVRDHIDPSVLFKQDFYYSSAIKTLVDHFADEAVEVTNRFLSNTSESAVLEFGSNDGVLLKPLADQGIKTVIGVDPAENLVESIKDDRLVLVNDFFNVPTAKRIVAEHGKVDLVMANNVYAHITDINSATDGVSEVLKDDGVFIFEVHYLGKIIEELQYDFIYHEHIYYYSLLALENHLARHNMVIFDVTPIPIHGGSMRYYATKNGSKYAKEESESVTRLREQEKDLGYDTPQRYQEFATQVANKKDELMKLLAEIKAEGKSIVGYGASGRANTIMQYCGITDDHIDCVIDDAPAKLGLYTPGSHLEIKSNSALETDKPDYVLIFAWAFYQEIANKSQSYLDKGGKFIVPLPEVKVIS